MKTKTNNKGSRALIRTALSLVLVSTLILSMAFTEGVGSDRQLASNFHNELGPKLEDGSYLADKLNDIKKENKVSDEVLLNIFVKYMKVKKYK